VPPPKIDWMPYGSPPAMESLTTHARIRYLPSLTVFTPPGQSSTGTEEIITA
jgi:hypothetical protein